MLFNVNWNYVLADISLLISNIINTVFIVLGNLKRAFYWSVQLYSSLCGALLVSDAVCLLATPGTWLKLAGISPTFGYFLGLLFTAIPSVKSMHPLYFSNIFSFSRAVMVSGVVGSGYFFFKEEVWRFLVVKFQVYWLNISFAYVQNAFTFAF